MRPVMQRLEQKVLIKDLISSCVDLGADVTMSMNEL